MTYIIKHCILFRLLTNIFATICHLR